MPAGTFAGVVRDAGAGLAERTAAELGRWTELGRRRCAAFLKAAGR